MDKDIFHKPYFYDTGVRSFFKGISWRILASIDTFLLSLLIFGSYKEAGSIALFEVITKVLLYYLHERLWNVIPFGRLINGKITHIRSIFKSVSWRFFGTLDTILLSFFITGVLSGAVKLGGAEVVTKIVLFYIHERIWTGIKWGRVYQNKTNEKSRLSFEGES
jgi:uncharacterized membrane protein